MFPIIFLKKYKSIKELNENSTLIKDIKKGVIIIGDIILENLEKINLDSDQYCRILNNDEC